MIVLLNRFESLSSFPKVYQSPAFTLSPLEFLNQWGYLQPIPTGAFCDQTTPCCAPGFHSWLWLLTPACC